MAALLWRALPDEVLVVISRLLLGVELLRLSHVDRRLFHVLLRADLYASRLSHVHYQLESTDASDSDLELIQSALDSKRQYALESSLQFSGQPFDPQEQWSPRSFAPVSLSIDTLFGLYAREDARSSSFTLDAWFSLSPIKQDIRQGGVLLGLQSGKCSSCVDGGRWSDFRFQILHVDAERNLYCSVTAEKPCVAWQLEMSRWYHVALVFEERSQKIYLDGELVDSQHDQEQQLEIFPYYNAQVGSGVFCDDTHTGWYAFHGVVDDLRIWHEAMDPDQIAALGCVYAAGIRRPMFSLKRDVPVLMAHGVENVLCSRPRERWCEVVATRRRTEDRES